MIKKLKFMMWLTCLSVNVFGFMLVFKAGKTPAVLYAAFVIATLAEATNRQGLVSPRR